MKPGHVNDFAPETLSLLHLLTTAGCTLVRGSNGEDSFPFTGDLSKFIDELLACDEARVYVRIPGQNGASCYVLYLVLGNSPGELVCDYSVHPLLDTITDAHNEAWDGKEQPTKLCKFALERHEFNKRADENRAAYALKHTLQLGVAVENFND